MLVPRFSLTELIVALVVSAILGAMLIGYFGSALMRSADPAHRLRRTAALMSVAERITNDYEGTYHSDLESLQTRLGQNPSPYGEYELVASDFIRFDESQDEESGDVTDVLKVKIRNGTGESLTLLFPYIP